MTAGFKKSKNIPANQGIIACRQVKKKGNLSAIIIIIMLIKKSQRVPGGSANKAQICYSFW